MSESKTEPDAASPSEQLRDDHIRRLYREILRRDADAGGLEHYRQVADVSRVETAMLASRELATLVLSGAYFDPRWPAPPRVLVFSAYGNGNLGDALQAITLQRLINEVSPSAEVWACSDMPAPFPFMHDRVLKPNYLRLSQIVNQFDLVVLGGGGLLAHPHQPISDPKWQQMVQAPVAIFAVGAERNVLRSSADLVKKACFVSGRDKESLACLKELRPDVAFVPDPVFWDKSYAPDGAVQPVLNGEEKAKLKSGRRLWILNLKVYGPDKQAFQELYDPARDKVCFFEPHVDYPIAADVAEALPIYSTQQLFTLMDDADIVVSARYHGCIFAMLRNKPVIGIRESKIMSLFHRFGARGAFYNTLAELTQFDWDAASPGPAFLEENRSLIRAGMHEAMQHVRSGK